MIPNYDSCLFVCCPRLQKPELIDRKLCNLCYVVMQRVHFVVY
uniref:Uncharacterized protein n=1 Tax=Arundo donax TaxID=35708 RepID=A0A0A8Y171_ARUDO